MLLNKEKDHPARDDPFLLLFDKFFFDLIND